MICVNDAVFDIYKKGRNLNSAIMAVHGAEIQERSEKSKAFSELSPLQMVMYDAGLNNDDQLDKMISLRNAYVSGGTDANQWLFPAWVETTLRQAVYDTDYLPYVVNTRIGVDGNIVQSPMLNLLDEKNKKAIKKVRIAELADIPTGKITMGEKAITLWKRGRAISLSYEVARRMRIDLIALQFQAIAGDLAQQNLEAAIDVACNGDGNDGSKPLQLGTTTNSKAIIGKDITAALLEYSRANNFNANVMIVPYDYLASISELTFDTQLASGVSLGVRFNIPQIKVQDVTIIGSDYAKVDGKEAMILLNRDLSLIRYEENGSNIQETENFIRNQSKLMTTTENAGYAIGVAGSNMYMEIKA